MRNTSLHSLRLLCVSILISVILAGCAYATGNIDHLNSGKQSGLLTGIVTKGPISPVERSGIPSRLPVSGVKLIISDLNEREIKSVVTDKEGRYRVNLPAGTYHIDMSPLAHGEFTKDLPASVTLTEGKETRLDIRIDTRIR